ncbi:ABC transporter substrate-binding protein [Pontibacillus marinus]|nr:extracellular solute-binding protein [Pontibacillus marinus]
MKNIKLFSIMMLVTVLLLAACSEDSSNESSSDNNDGGKKEIEFWTMQLKPTFTDYIEGVISDFEKENPNISIKWVDVPAADLEKKILSAVSSNTAPDVVNLNPTFGSKIAALDGLVNMDEALSDEQKSRYVQGAWKANQLNGNTFAIPWYLNTEVTLNNKAIYEEAGLDPNKPPKTYEKAMEYAKTVKEETGKYGYYPSLDLSLVLQHMVKMGADLTNEEGTKAAFNTQEGLNTFKYFTELYKNDLIPREALTGDQRETIDMYSSGQVGFFAGSNFITQIKKNAPDVYDQTFASQSITGKSGKVTLSVQNVVVPNQTKHQDAAVKFALFLTNAKNQLAFTKLVPILPSAKSALDDPYFSELPEDATATDQVRITAANQLDKAEVLIPPMENYNKLKDAMHDAISAAMLEEMSPQEALDQAEKEWNKILSE